MHLGQERAPSRIALTPYSGPVASGQTATEAATMSQLSTRLSDSTRRSDATTGSIGMSTLR